MSIAKLYELDFRYISFCGAKSVPIFKKIHKKHLCFGGI